MSKLCKNVFHLTEIAEWPETQKVSLPSVQRGFVWRPYQIENLWDSLLRGFPVGAFVLSPKPSGDQFELLDGQQRATAICLGFGLDTFRDSQNSIRVFIDLAKPDPGDNRKFIFRVITKSHPWGYRRKDNTKTLSADSIRKAMDMYGIDDHLTADFSSFYPYEATLPVPFSLFLKHLNSSAESLLEEITEIPFFQEKRKIWYSLGNTREKLLNLIQQILDATKLMLCPENGQNIPALYLNFERIKAAAIESEAPIKSEKDDHEPTEDENQEVDEIENLFVRLNAGGTPLRGEELNYSILKAHLNPKIQEKIEYACKGLIRPARFITITYRLFQLLEKNNHTEGLRMSIKPKQFQNAVSKPETLAPFEAFLIQLIEAPLQGKKTLLETIKHLLSYEKDQCPYGLPYLTVRKIATVAPEIMFMLFYRLVVYKDHFEFNTPEHKKMIGMVTLFLWLGKGAKHKDHSKLLTHIWICLKEKDKLVFWSKSTVQRAILNVGMANVQLFYQHNWKGFLSSVKEDQKDFFAQFQKPGFRNFIEPMFFNRDLLLYAQRHFLENFFEQQEFDLDDTNTPFDWDHLSPHTLIKNKKSISETLRGVYHTNGNFRAWPYSLNRMDQDHSPAKKLDPLNKKLEEFLKHKKNLNASLFKDLKATLSQWSYCSPEWAKCEIYDIKKDWRKVFNLIWDRNFKILHEWYQNLHIADLVEYKITNFKEVLDQRRWELDPEDSEFSHYCDESKNSWVLKKPFAIDAVNHVYLYLTYPSNDNRILKERAFEFGIFQAEGPWIESLDKNKTFNIEDLNLGEDYIQQNFTLISFEKRDVIRTLTAMAEWLDAFPDPRLKGGSEIFINTLTQEYQKKIAEARSLQIDRDERIVSAI